MISKTFESCAGRGHAALVPYVTAGYPEVDSTLPVLEALVDAGADVLEVGIPFSDTLADGPTIQRSSFVSLQNGTTVKRVLADVAAFRERHSTPVVLFTYLNPVLRYGVDAFIRDAVKAGADGVLITDLPSGSDVDVERRLSESPLDLIRLIAPTTEPDRLADAVAGGSGFVYYISRTGVTGAKADLREGLSDEVRRLKERVDLPVAVGFGISTPHQAESVASVADGVVVGSAVIKALDEGGIEGARTFLASLRAGMDRASRP